MNKVTEYYAYFSMRHSVLQLHANSKHTFKIAVGRREKEKRMKLYRKIWRNNSSNRYDLEK